MQQTQTSMPGTGYPLPAESYDDDVGLAEMLGVLRRRIRVLLGISIPVVALAIAVVLSLTPRYTAETLIMIEAENGNHILTLDSVVAGLSGDRESVQSEAIVLGSASLADRVIQRLKLDQDAEFSGDLVDPDMPAQARYSAVVERFLDRLEVAPVPNSRVISVRFSSEDASKAALIANTLADEYLQARLETKFQLTRQASNWLSERIGELQARVREAEAEIEKKRSELGLLEGNGVTLASQQLVELNTQLVMARTARAEAEARLQQVQRLTRTPGGMDSTIEVLESPLIQRLREQEAEIERRVAELSSELGDKHPRMIQLRAEAANLQERIKREIGKIIAGLRNQVAVAKAREESLQKSLDQIKQRVTAANQDDVELRAMEREAAANRALLDTLLMRQKETVSQDDSDFQQPDATIIAQADIPVEPSYPRTMVVVGIALIGSLLIGLLVILIMELLDGGFRSGEQFERVTGVPSIGFVPAVKKPREYKTLPGYLAGRPASAFGESMRTLNWSLKLASPDKPPRIVLVTSSLPGEGKTTVASSLATAQSKAGQRVVLVDADIRRPGCHSINGVELEPGLTNLLSGEHTLDSVLGTSQWCGLNVIPAGTPSPQAPNLLGSKRMRDLITELLNRFDLVVIDSPPVMAAADARILARLADSTILAVHWGKTRRRTVRLTVRQLQAAGAHLAGGLLTMVDIRRNSRYGYGDSGAYAGDLEKYYAG